MTSNIVQKKVLISSNSNKRYSIIDINNKESNINIEFVIKKNAKANIFISILGYDSNKNYKIICHHEDNTSISDVKVFGIAVKKCNINIELLAKIDKNTFENNCFQSIKGILLDDNSKIVGKPMLDIDTNLIKACHSLSIGNINEDHLFYLVSKGLTRSQAIKEIIHSYFNVTMEHEKEEEKEKIINDIEKVLGYDKY